MTKAMSGETSGNLLKEAFLKRQSEIQ